MTDSIPVLFDVDPMVLTVSAGKTTAAVGKVTHCKGKPITCGIIRSLRIVSLGEEWPGKVEVTLGDKRTGDFLYGLTVDQSTEAHALSDERVVRVPFFGGLHVSVRLHTPDGGLDPTVLKRSHQIRVVPYLDVVKTSCC